MIDRLTDRLIDQTRCLIMPSSSSPALSPVLSGVPLLVHRADPLVDQIPAGGGRPKGGDGAGGVPSVQCADGCPHREQWGMDRQRGGGEGWVAKRVPNQIASRLHGTHVVAG